MHQFLSLTLLGIMSLFAQACDKPAEEAPLEPADAQTWLPLAVGDIQIEAQLAISPAEQRRGLMFREELGQNQGMLFVYRAPQQMSFWMANTKINLDIGFFDHEGVLREIYTMFAGDTNPTASRSDNLTYALEMNAGWFAQNNILPGAKLDETLLDQALKRRKFTR